MRPPSPVDVTVLEQIAHVEAPLGDDIFRLAPGLAVYERTAIVALSDAYARVPVSVAPAMFRMRAGDHPAGTNSPNAFGPFQNQLYWLHLHRTPRSSVLCSMNLSSEALSIRTARPTRAALIFRALISCQSVVLERF